MHSPYLGWIVPLEWQESPEWLESEPETDQEPEDWSDYDPIGEFTL
jgi:hypothetical protein